MIGAKEDITSYIWSKRRYYKLELEQEKILQGVTKLKDNYWQEWRKGSPIMT